MNRMVGGTEDRLPACQNGSRSDDDNLEGYPPPRTPYADKMVGGKEDKLPACRAVVRRTKADLS